MSAASLFCIELANEINLLRDQPKHYRENLLKIKYDKDDKTGNSDLYLREGKLSVPTKQYLSMLDTLDKSKVVKILTIDPLLNKVCEKIYKSKIKPLQNFKTIEKDVYKQLDSVISEYGRPAGKVSFLIDQGNIQPKTIVLYNLVYNPVFLFDKHQVFGCYQENGITVMFLTRYFVGTSQSIDHLSDSCIEIEEEVIEEIKYSESQIIEDPDMEINKEWGHSVDRVEKTSKIEEVNGEIVKTIFVKKYMVDGRVESDVIQKKSKK